MSRNLTLAALGLLLVAAGCKVSQPGSVETKVLNQVKQKFTIGGKDDKNPLPASEANIREGQEHFGHHCMICHGLDGQNTGVLFADRMAPPVPPLDLPDVQRFTDGQIHWIIANGVYPSGMPAWKGILDDQEMWNIVHFIRHLPAKGSLGVPAVYRAGEEEHEMHHMHENAGKAPAGKSAGKKEHKHSHPN